MNESARDGLYETLLTRQVRAGIDALHTAIATTRRVEEVDQAHVLARHVSEPASTCPGGHQGHPDRRLAIANDLVERLADHDQILEPLEQLLSIAEPAAPGIVTYGLTRPRRRCRMRRC